MKRGLLASLVVHLLLVLAAAVVALPVLWMVCASFKRGEDLAGPILLPWGHLDRLTLENYRILLGRQAFGTWLANSLFLASAYTVVVVILSSLGGFALARYEFRGKRIVMGVMLGTLMLPWIVMMPGSYRLVRWLGWIDTYWAILAPGAVSVLGTFLYRQAMLGIPDDVLAAARVDGCSEWRVWWEVALPMVRPMTGALVLISFLANWNSYLWPAMVLQSEGRFTLPLGMANLLALPEYRVEFGVLMAGTVLSVLPVAGLFFLLQREFVEGLASGGVKG